MHDFHCCDEQHTISDSVIYTCSQKHKIFFSFYINQIYFSDIDIESPINSLSHNLKSMMLRLTLIALRRKKLETRIFTARGFEFLKFLSKLVPVFMDVMKVMDETNSNRKNGMPPSTLISCT